MRVELTAQSDIHGQSIELRWTCTTTTPTVPQWYLVRRTHTYPTNIGDGFLVLCLGHNSNPDQPGSLHPPETPVQVTILHALNSGNWVYSYTVTDKKGLTTEIIYYYTLFDVEGNVAGRIPVSRNYGFADQLYRLLPAIHRLYDEPNPEVRGQGQLRHFLEIFGLTLDQIRSSAEGLRDRHNVLETRADFLPHLAQLIGWDLDLNLDELSQRNEIVRAPEIYRTVGTLPNLAALVNRATGWMCRIKEYGQNVCLSNAPEILRMWEIWEMRFDTVKRAWQPATPITQTEHFDGGPRYIQDKNSRHWLFWHSNRRGRREIWCQQLDVETQRPLPIIIVLHDDQRNALEVAESFTVLAIGDDIWLFFDSGRPGQRDLWATNLVTATSDSGGHLAWNLSKHVADDCNSAAVAYRGQPRLFWQSNRSGVSDIWTCTHDGTQWGEPTVITSGTYRHEKPTVVVDDQDVLWLFYCRDDQDAHRRVYCQTSVDGQTWSPGPLRITEGPFDDSPAVVIENDNKLSLFWHAKDQVGQWQIWSLAHNANVWSKDPIQVTDHPTANKEPSAIVDSSNGLRLYFRSQRRGYFSLRNEAPRAEAPYLSCTFDTKNAEMVSFRGTPRAFGNRIHYTYDTRQTNDSWCAFNTVGVYLTPTTEEAKLVEEGRLIAEAVIRRFLPVQVRVFVEIEPPAYHELVYTYDFPDEKSQHHIEEQYSDSLSLREQYSELQDTYDDVVSNWVWLHSLDESHRDHKTVDFRISPPDTFQRTWQRGISTKAKGSQ